jgi:ferrous iron transport protein A
MKTTTTAAGPLDRLAAGDEGRIVSIAPGDEGRLVRLSSFGLVPGAVVRLQQSSPAVVVRLGETVLAIDAAIAGSILVERVERSDGGHASCTRGPQRG